MFVDEVKQATHNLLVAAAALPPRRLAHARKVVCALVLPGQRRLHLVKEKPGRRKLVLDAIAELAPAVTVYEAPTTAKRRQREVCLRALVDDLVEAGATRLVLERDDVVLDVDKRVLYRRIHELGHPDLRYDHLRAHEEPLLAIPDAIAWCWNRGGWWRQHVADFVTMRSV